MNNSAAKVGEIFREAGTAFNKLSEMTLMLQPMDDSPPGGKWSDAEVEMLRGCINRFAVELNKISQHIKNRTMRHLKCLLEMDSGKTQVISGSPQQSQNFTEELDTLETESQCDFNETFLNIFVQGFPDNEVKHRDIDQFLLKFDPSVVNSAPPDNIMQEDMIRQQPSSEFEDLQDSNYNKAVPSLISLLDADVNATPHSECKNLTESSMANIGTLHAELPNCGRNLDEATGATSDLQELNDTSPVSREAHFSFRQAKATWHHVSPPAMNQTMGVPIKSEGNFNLYTASSGRAYTSLQAPDEPAFTKKIRFNESQDMRQLDTDSSLLTQNILCPGSFSNYSLNNDRFGTVQGQRDNLLAGNNESQIPKKENTHGNILRPGYFNNYSLNNDPFGSVQEQRDNLLAGINEAQIPKKENTHGNILRPGFFNNYSLNNDPFASVQEQIDNLLAGNNDAQIPKKENTHGNILRPGSFNNYSLNNDPFGSVQEQTDNLLAGNNEAQIPKKENTHGNILLPGSFNNYSLNNDPFGSVQEQSDNLLAGNNEAQIPKKENTHGNILLPGSFNNYSLNNDPFGSVQAPRDNLREGNNETPIAKKEKPHGNILWPGSFSNYSLNNDPFGSVQARNEEQKGSSTNRISFTNLFGNNLYSANSEPVTSAQAQTYFSSIRADTNKQVLASSARRTSGYKGRERPRRRRESLVTRESAEPNISPPDESTAKPSQNRMTRSRRKRACHYNIEDPDKKKY